MKSLLQSATIKQFLLQYKELCVHINNNQGRFSYARNNQYYEQIILHVLLNFLYWIDGEKNNSLVEKYEWFIYPNETVRVNITEKSIEELKNEVDKQIRKLIDIYGQNSFFENKIKHTQITGLNMIIIQTKHLKYHIRQIESLRKAT
jgi:hypothetical protein